MAKFDISKYWEFRVWVKSQIAQLRELLSNYQQGGGGTGGGGDFDPDGAYPNMSVGKATTATTLASAPAISASGNGIVITAGGKTSSTLSLKTINGASIIGSGNIDTGGDFDPNGTYPNMSVGTATDLSGRIEASPAVFTYRPSAGDKSIKDDNAFIRRVKGNSVVFNQVAKEINSTHWKVYNSNNASISFNSNIATVTVTNYASDIYGYNIGARLTSTVPIVPNHKYLIAAEIKSDIAMIFGLELNSKFTEIGFVTNEWTYCANIETSNRTVTSLNISPRFPFTAELNTYSFRNLICIDLTAMFGTGNEPTTVEEFRALYPNSYYPYNTGELRNLVCSGIKTVGFNEFNGTYARVLPNESYYLGGSYTSIGFAKELGEATETISIPSNRIYTPTQLGYIYASGTDICINLHHTGYRDGEYEPYKEVTHTLPLSKITNGEPLRKAGSVYDEINETEYIRRVGVVDMGTLIWVAEGNNIFVVYQMPNMIVTTTDNSRLDGLFCAKYATDSIPDVGPAMADKTMKRHQGRLYLRDTSFTDVPSFKAALSGVLLQYELAEPIVKPIETPINFNYYVEDFGTEEAILAENSAPFSADVVYQFNAVDNIRQNRISIQKLNDIFSGSGGEYVRADGSWGYIADLKGNFFVKPTLKRIRTGISELSDTIQIIHPYLTEHVGDAKIVLMAVKRRGGTYYDRATNAKGRRKKRKAWGELHYAAMPNTEINHNTIEMPNGASFEAWQGVILNACGRIPEGLENAREPYNVNVASKDLADFFAANGAIFVGKTPVIRLGVALRIPNPNFIDYGNGNKMWDYNDVTGKWEYKYLYSDVAEVVVKSQMLRTGGYVLGLELV